jgi:two-component system OmpR family response regulator
MRILIVEDEITLNRTLLEGLLDEGYQVDSVESYKDAEYFIDIRNYDLVITDWMLPDGNGVDFTKIVKNRNSRTSVILMSARDDKESEIKALEVGADDYIKKPFDFDNLLARIETRLRFGGSTTIDIDKLSINPDEEKIIYDGNEVELKGKPFEVLTHLARHRDQIVSKEQLLDAIWEEPELVTPNVIEVAINQIRQKMDKPLNIATIETIRRRGYRFCYSVLEEVSVSDKVLFVKTKNDSDDTLVKNLQEKNYSVDVVNLENIKMENIKNYALMITDLLETDNDTFDFIENIKKTSNRTSIVIITSKDDSRMEISSLKVGVDDYIQNVYDQDIILARIEARLRFGGLNTIEIDKLSINPDEEKIIYDGNEVELKGKPFEVLTHLARHRDQIVSKEQLLDAIWEEPELVTPNVIEVAINQIRQKMDKPLNIATIETIRRRGYRFCYPSAEEAK